MLKDLAAPEPATASRQRAILESKRVADRLTVRAWRDLLAPLARFDVEGDRARKASRAWLLRGIVGVVGGLFVLAISGGSPFVLPVPAAGLAVAVGAGLRYRKLRKLDLSNNLSQLVLPLLRVLDEETSPDSLVALELNLGVPTSADKLQSTENLPADRGYFDIVARHYRDPWMTGKAELLGGSRLEWAIVDEVVEVKRSRRSRSGKTKTKKRFKKRCLMTVAVSLPDASYAVTAGDVADGHKVRVKSSETKQTFKVARAVKLSTLEPPPVGVFLDLIASVFGRATPVPPEGARS